MRRHTGKPYAHPQDSVNKILVETLTSKDTCDENSLHGSITPPEPEKNSFTHIPQMSQAKLQPFGVDWTLAESHPSMLLLLEKILAAVCVQTQTMAEEIRVEMREYSDNLCRNLEKRLSTHIIELQKEIRGSPHDNSLETCLNTIEACLVSPDLCNENLDSNNFVESMLDDAALSSHSDVGVCTSPMKLESPQDRPEVHANLVNQISDHVTARVNANIVETHQSVQESFATLLDMIYKAPWVEPTKIRTDADLLYDAVMETQKQCKSLSVEMRQMRQRWNQDCSKSEIRFGKLEEALQAIENVKLGDALQAIEESYTPRKVNSPMNQCRNSIMDQCPDSPSSRSSPGSIKQCLGACEGIAEEATSPVVVDGHSL
jgi:hypothetical protein